MEQGTRMKPDLLWGNLVHLSYNMWCDTAKNDWPESVNHCTKRVKKYFRRYIGFRPELRCDSKTWRATTDAMARSGMNLLVIDLGDAVKYESHPELAVKGAWSVDALRLELSRLRSLGIEPIPKLNLSTGHDAWLGPYSRQVSTPPYYKVVGELLDEVIRLFDRPRYFHLGMDEEDWANQRYYEYAVIRQGELWWHDLKFFIDRVEKKGVRAWVWSDYFWHHPDRFLKRMPKSVLQSNWYYAAAFSAAELSALGKSKGKDWVEKWVAPRVRAYKALDEAGYDQIPTGSNWSEPSNFIGTVHHCRANLGSKRLKGFLMAPWAPMLPPFKGYYQEAIDLVSSAKA